MEPATAIDVADNCKTLDVHVSLNHMTHHAVWVVLGGYGKRQLLQMLWSIEIGSKNNLIFLNTVRYAKGGPEGGLLQRWWAHGSQFEFNSTRNKMTCVEKCRQEY